MQSQWQEARTTPMLLLKQREGEDRQMHRERAREMEPEVARERGNVKILID